jgi:hypothetical protein
MGKRSTMRKMPRATRSFLLKSTFVGALLLAALSAVLVLAPVAMADSADSVLAQSWPAATNYELQPQISLAPSSSSVSEGALVQSTAASASGYGVWGIGTRVTDPFGWFAWDTKTWMSFSWSGGQVTSPALYDWDFISADSWYMLESGPTVTGSWVPWNGKSHGCYRMVVKYQIVDTVFKIGVIKRWYLTHTFYAYANGTCQMYATLR